MNAEGGAVRAASLGVGGECGGCKFRLLRRLGRGSVVAWRIWAVILGRLVAGARCRRSVRVHGAALVVGLRGLPGLVAAICSVVVAAAGDCGLAASVS